MKIFIAGGREPSGVRWSPNCRPGDTPIAFRAAPGPGLADEETPLAFDASPAVAADARVVTELERRLLGSPEVEGIALRYGFFYGPGAWRCEVGRGVSFNSRT